MKANSNTNFVPALLILFVLAMGAIIAQTPPAGPSPSANDPSSYSPAPKFAALTVVGQCLLTNQVIVGGSTLASTNTFQVDTPQLIKAQEVDTNGNSYFGGALVAQASTAASTTNLYFPLGTTNCILMKDAIGAGYSRIWTSNGVLIVQAVP